MRKCPYCGKWFKNKQAVRGHLKSCPFYTKTIRKSEEAKLELLLKLLLWICKTDKLPMPVRPIHVKDYLGLSEEETKQFFKWMKNSEFYTIAEALINCKEKELSHSERTR